tara:strand:+ start:19886 stop:20152 length:267 start_codon:yes stop_codon:yes gene_type:complete
MAPQIRLFLVSFGIKLVGLGEELPIDMFGALPCIVDLVLRKFRGKTVKRTLMDTADKTFHYLVGQKFQILEERAFVQLRLQIHVTKVK